MSCFIHREKDGVAVCKQCGKNMCEDCSSLTYHSGLCPACYKPQMQREIAGLNKEKDAIFWKLIVKIALSVLLCWTIIYPLFQIPFFVTYPRETKAMQLGIERRIGIIESINYAMARGSSDKI